MGGYPDQFSGSQLTPGRVVDESQRAALAVMRRMVDDRDAMWTALDVLGLTGVAVDLLNGRAALRGLLPFSATGSRPVTLETVSDSRDDLSDVVAAAPAPRWCKCDPTKHDLNDPAAAVTKSNGRKECRVALNRRRRAKKARRAAERGTA